MNIDVESVLILDCRLSKDQPVILGVSGGPDSLCLLDLMNRAGYPIILGHFNHQLRPEAVHEAQIMEGLADKMSLPLRVDGADVRGYADGEGISLEDGARRLRYQFLFAMAREFEAQAVAVGHTADDQVETVLMHVLRGSGLSGLKGMSRRTILGAFDAQIPLVRPLLGIWRHETVAYCASHGLEPVYDPSNDSLEFKRNRIRHLLIPELEGYNPNFRKALVRMAETLGIDHELLDEYMSGVWLDSMIGTGEDVVTFDFSRLSNQPIGTMRNLIRRAVHYLDPQVDLNFAAVERGCRLIMQPGVQSQLDLQDGFAMLHEGGSLHVFKKKTGLPDDQWPQLQGIDTLSVPVPGMLELGSGWHLTCELIQRPDLDWEKVDHNQDRFRVWVDADRMAAGLQLRVRRPGDVFQPLGLDGHVQKLSDFMVNEKLPARARKSWPLLCSGEQIVWIPGYRMAHPFRLMESSQHILLVSLSRR